MNSRDLLKNVQSSPSLHLTAYFWVKFENIPNKVNLPVLQYIVKLKSKHRSIFKSQEWNNWKLKLLKLNLEFSVDSWSHRKQQSKPLWLKVYQPADIDEENHGF